MAATPVELLERVRGSIRLMVVSHFPVMGSVMYCLPAIVMSWTWTTFPNTIALALAWSLSGTRMSPSALLMVKTPPVPGLSTTRLKWYDVTFWIAACALVINCCAVGAVAPPQAASRKMVVSKASKYAVPLGRDGGFCPCMEILLNDCYMTVLVGYSDYYTLFFRP